MGIEKNGVTLKPVELAKPPEQKGWGNRCCIDLTSLFSEGLGFTKSCGLLVGAFSKGLFLIQAENLENIYGINQRPFRVNAGPASLYVLVPPRGKDGRYQTKYLWELRAGDLVLMVDYQGHGAEAEVTRNKIERRSLTMITAYHPTLKNLYTGEDDFIRTFIQTAETSHFVDENGDPLPLRNLRQGSKILACVENPHRIGRHFGMAVEGVEIFEK